MKSCQSQLFELHFKDITSPLYQANKPAIQHVILEALDIPIDLISEAYLEKNVARLMEFMDFHVVNSFLHQFEPHGISYVVVLAESHLAIHTWPEIGYIHLDIVTCTQEEINLQQLETCVKTIFKPKQLHILQLDY